MDELIQGMRDKGLVFFVSNGKAWAVFNFIKVMAETRPITPQDIKINAN